MIHFFLIFFVATSTSALNSTDSERFIVGGRDAKPEQFPYLTSMRRSDTKAHICGGAILNSRWILTAAHCITASNFKKPEEFVFVVGTISRTSTVDGVWHETKQFIFHPEWNQFINRHDIALTQTVETVVFNAMVRPVSLSPDYIEGGRTGVLAGFGQTRVEPRSDVKQFFEAKTLSNPDCKRVQSKFPFNGVRIFESNICFENAVGFGACGGDSGSSIVINGVSVGVSSWVAPDCALGYPDMYTRTSIYFDWIKNVTNNE